MLYDTDVLIWVEKGHRGAAQIINKDPTPSLSIQSMMELLQGSKTRKEQQVIKDFLTAQGFQVWPLTENIGHRALVYIEQFAQSHGLLSADALIAATAIENNLPLVSANIKHYRPIKELNFIPFRP